VGSFNADKDADNVKAKLALLGFEAVVLTVPSKNNEVLHKVRVGPMTDNAQIIKIKNDLIKNDFKPILVKATTNNINN
jgi:cell division protein FtsN